MSSENEASAIAAGNPHRLSQREMQAAALIVGEFLEEKMTDDCGINCEKTSRFKNFAVDRTKFKETSAAADKRLEECKQMILRQNWIQGIELAIIIPPVVHLVEDNYTKFRHFIIKEQNLFLRREKLTPEEKQLMKITTKRPAYIICVANTNELTKKVMKERKTQIAFAHNGSVKRNSAMIAHQQLQQQPQPYHQEMDHSQQAHREQESSATGHITGFYHQQQSHLPTGLQRTSQQQEPTGQRAIGGLGPQAMHQGSGTGVGYPIHHKLQPEQSYELHQTQIYNQEFGNSQSTSSMHRNQAATVTGHLSLPMDPTMNIYFGEETNKRARR